MTPADYLAWILKIALLVHDSHGFTRPMPSSMASAIADVTTDTTEAAVLVVLAFRESSYRDTAKGDYWADPDGVVRAHSCGAWQTPCLVTPIGDVKKQAAIAIGIYRRSATLCPSHPLAIYASGSCSSLAGRRISNARIAEASALAAVSP